MSFPFRSASQQAASQPILVIDDEPAIVETVTEILQFEGYQVVSADNGATALRLIERQLPRLILLDMRMPVLDGWAFATALRARGIHIPIIVMTAAQDAARWAAEVEAASYVSKPFDLNQLLAVVERLLAGPNIDG